MESSRTWAENHNNVALLDESMVPEGFTYMVKFINATSIRYALTVNPTIYHSYLKQFWFTAKVKTINGENRLRPR